MRYSFTSNAACQNCQRILRFNRLVNAIRKRLSKKKSQIVHIKTLYDLFCKTRKAIKNDTRMNKSHAVTVELVIIGAFRAKSLNWLRMIVNA